MENEIQIILKDILKEIEKEKIALKYNYFPTFTDDFKNGYESCVSDIKQIINGFVHEENIKI